MSKLIIKAVFAYRFEHEVEQEFNSKSEAEKYFKKNKKYFEDVLMEELENNSIKRNNITDFELIDSYIDYSKYIGKLGRFWNRSQLPVVIDLLNDYYTDEGGKVTFELVNNEGEFDSFRPLTEEEIKILNL